MKRTYVRDIKPSLDGKKVKIFGWVHDIRDQSRIKFVLLRDVSGIVQCISFEKDGIFSEISKISKESVIEVVGEVKKSKQAPAGVEVHIEKYKILNKAEAVLPIPVVEKGKVSTGLSKRLDYRFLDLHKPKIQAIFKIESEIAHSFREYFYKKGFIEIQTPCIISSASEGGTELFPARYFEKDAYLAQSPQLYKQMGACSIEKVTMIVPVWRAEKHNTSRHINEARQMDIEMAFVDEFVVMKEFEKSVRFIVKNVIKKCSKELELLGKKLVVPKAKYLSYKETIKVLQKKKIKIEYGDDIIPEAEKKICEIYPDTIVFVYDWPLDLKPFYIMPKDGEISRGFDAIYGGIEISSGGQRIHLPDLISERLKAKGLDPKNFKYYIDSFKFGAPEHSGWSIGLERFTMALLGFENIRETTLFVRDRDRLVP